MEIQQLKHLIAAAQHGNMVKAADEVSISQSGLSRSIKTLEDRLGVPLLWRKTTGVEPTTYGDSLIRRAKLIVNEVERAIEEVRAIEQARTGDVRIGVTQNFSSYLVPDIISALAIDRPDLRLDVTTGGFVELIEQVKSEALDFGFGIMGAIRHDEGIVVETLCRHRSRVIARASHPLAGAKNLTIADLASTRWALLKSEAVQRGFADFFARHGHAVPPQALRADSVTLIRRVVLTSDVLTVLPHEAVDSELSQGLLVEVECPIPVDQARIGLFFRSGGALTPQAHLLADRLRLAFAAAENEGGARTTGVVGA
jgi:DNA-binding transcriptional LysR family regulator